MSRKDLWEGYIQRRNWSVVHKIYIILDLREWELEIDFKLSLEQFEVMAVALGLGNAPALFRS